jgi:hypothetical protein
LHVLVDVDDSTMTRLQILELIKTLQADIKKTGREVLITSKTDGLSHEYYFKLDPKVDPRIIVQTLMEFPKNNTRKSASHLDHKGQPFSAFLYVGSGYNSVAGMQYLYSKLPKHKLATIYLKEPKYDVYPLIQDSWVNEK